MRASDQTDARIHFMAGSNQATTPSHDVCRHGSRDIGQPHFSASVAIRQSFVVEAQPMPVGDRYAGLCSVVGDGAAGRKAPPQFCAPPVAVGGLSEMKCPIDNDRKAVQQQSPGSRSAPRVTSTRTKVAAKRRTLGRRSYPSMRTLKGFQPAFETHGRAGSPAAYQVAFLFLVEVPGRLIGRGQSPAGCQLEQIVGHDGNGLGFPDCDSQVSLRRHVFASIHLAGGTEARSFSSTLYIPVIVSFGC